MKRLTCLIVAVLALMLAGSAPAAAQRITDSGYRTVAHIKSDGTIQDAGYRTIGHAPDIPLAFAWTAFFFFFME